jgi:hypothetical protein
MNTKDSIMTVARALEEGAILTAHAPNGSDTYTVGPNTEAVTRRNMYGRVTRAYALYGYGKSRWLIPSYKGSAMEVASVLVEHVGRGNATQAVKKWTKVRHDR